MPTKKPLSYKVYSHLDVECSLQLYGSTWRVILRGSQQQIKDTFNGIWNFCGSSGELEFTDQWGTIATFWSSEKQMRKFFSLLYFFRTTDEELAQYKGQPEGRDYKVKMQAWVGEQIEALRLTAESFMPYRKRDYNPLFELSDNKAEKPDHDFKDAVLNHAFKDNSRTEEVESLLGTSLE